MIIDTDMSSDDVMALTYLLERPDVSIQAITVSGTGVADGRPGAENVLRLIRALGVRRPIPMAFGPAQPTIGNAAFPRAWRTAADSMFGLNLPPWSGAAPTGNAVQLLTAILSHASRKVTLVTLGPLTDVALALRARPAIAGKIARIYTMAGAIEVPGNEPMFHRAEWNAYIDPRAADIVLHSGIPVTVVPLDASNNVPITTFVTEAVQAHQQTPAMRLLATLLNDPFYTQAPVYFWDPLTAVAATDGRVLTQRHARLGITQVPSPGYGETWTGPDGAPVTLGVSADSAAFTSDFLSTLNGGRAIALPSVPRSQHLTISFDGTRYAYRVPAAVRAGQISVRLVNSGTMLGGGYQFIVGKLSAGKTLSDVNAVIERGKVKAVPKWFHVTSVLPAPPGADAAWGVTLGPGRYALVCQLDATGALRALTEIRTG
jgi:inosine-uridine nucleoside N-ribohydrolase